MSIDKVLIIDGDAAVRNFLTEILQRKNIEAISAESPQKAIAILKKTAFDMVITEMKMPEITGFDILRKVKELSAQTIVIIVTNSGTIENAVEAMQLGAFYYLIKPFSSETIELLIEKARQHIFLVEENRYLRQQLHVDSRSSNRKLIGKSPALQQIISSIPHIAKSNASIFIHGESGTGKEVVANAIHYNSLRNNRPFIKVNCAAIPDTLIESEFFGHEEGAFTGARTKRCGRFELANNGTLLLDEITEISLPLQAKLLRVIQEQEFERVGGTKSVKVDVRLISTSNRDVKEAIAEKHLREDLYYRLNVVPVYIPPLRERREDIIPLAEFFLEKMARGKEPIKKLTQESEKKLADYPWPGNARELANIIERAIVLDDSLVITPDHLYLDNINFSKKSTPQGSALPVGISLHELEKQLIIETLHAEQNDRAKTAEILGISVRTLSNKLSRYGK